MLLNISRLLGMVYMAITTLITILLQKILEKMSFVVIKTMNATKNASCAGEEQMEWQQRPIHLGAGETFPPPTPKKKITRNVKFFIVL